MLLAIGRIGRHQIGDIAVNEELARIGPENRRHMNARIAAGDHHRARSLTVLGKAAIPGTVFDKGGRAPAVIALDQILRQRNGFNHGVLIDRSPA